MNLTVTTRVMIGCILGMMILPGCQRTDTGANLVATPTPEVKLSPREPATLDEMLNSTLGKARHADQLWPVASANGDLYILSPNGMWHVRGSESVKVKEVQKLSVKSSKSPLKTPRERWMWQETEQAKDRQAQLERQLADVEENE